MCIRDSTHATPLNPKRITNKIKAQSCIKSYTKVLRDFNLTSKTKINVIREKENKNHILKINQKIKPLRTGVRKNLNAIQLIFIFENVRNLVAIKLYRRLLSVRILNLQRTIFNVRTIVNSRLTEVLGGTSSANNQIHWIIRNMYKRGEKVMKILY